MTKSMRTGPVIPPEALNQGGTNIALPKKQRVADRVKADGLSDGPKRGKKGNYEPASYTLRSGSIRTDR